MSSYTSSQAHPDLGTTIGIGATPTVIGEVKTIKQSGRKTDTEEVTNMNSTAKEFIPTIADWGEWDVEGNLVSSDAGIIAVETAFSSKAVSAFTIQRSKTATQVTSGDKYTFNAIVTELDYNFDAVKAATFSLKLKVSGVVTFIAGT